jgi:S1-C subfamily serine protease
MKIFLITFFFVLLLTFQFSCRRIDFSQTAKNMSARVVQLVFISQQTESEHTPNIISIGTGFLVDDNGYVITASHLIDIGEQYAQQTQTQIKKLGIIILPPTVVSNSNLSLTQTNDFEVISRDDKHDLALLKVKTNTVINPSNGERLDTVHYSNDIYGALSVGNLQFTENIAQNISFALTGYSSSQLVLETKIGKIVSNKITNIDKIQLSFPNGNVDYNITDYYLADVQTNSLLNGSPVYSTVNGKLLGVCVHIIQNESDNSGIIGIIPSRFIMELLINNDVR